LRIPPFAQKLQLYCLLHILVEGTVFRQMFSAFILVGLQLFFELLRIHQNQRITCLLDIALFKKELFVFILVFVDQPFTVFTISFLYFKSTVAIMVKLLLVG